MAVSSMLLGYQKITAEWSKISKICKNTAGKGAIALLCSALRASSGMVASFFPVLPLPTCAGKVLTNEQLQQSAHEGSACDLHGKAEGAGLV